MNLHVSEKIQMKKTVSWTIISTSITFLVVFAFTGSWESATAVSLTERIIKIFVYYPHERWWHRKYKAAKKAISGTRNVR